VKIYLWFVLLFLYTTASGQGTGLTVDKVFKTKNFLTFIPVHYKTSYPVTSIHPVSPKQVSIFNSPYQYQHELGFFCKVELKWDKVLYRPLRFRLGSYDYVNRLEGK
jgi:hypothetical protein